MSKISMRKISEILRQRYDLKLTYREIARSQNISTSMVSEYIWRAKAARFDSKLPEGITEEELYQKLFLPVTQTATRPLPDWQMIHQELRRKGMTLRLLWREYRDQYPDGVGYTQFCILYRRHVKTISLVMHQNHKAGEKTFVDYAGMTVPWIDPSIGEIHEAQIFVGCLSASQLMFVEATAMQQLPDWIKSHIRMFEYFGGVIEMVVPVRYEVIYETV
ncbi:MAG: transposase [Gammaproteobacteria bacterium]|nr:transposase [Gammaproteobacteria bacterium]MCW5584161.1 transposase [Gammaproteobacteria bacterium]